MPFRLNQEHPKFGSMEDSQFLKFESDHTKRIREQRTQLKTKVGTDTLSRNGPERISYQSQKEPAVLLRNEVAKNDKLPQQLPATKTSAAKAPTTLQKIGTKPIAPNSTAHPIKTQLLAMNKINRVDTNNRLSENPLQSMISSK